MTPNGFWIPVTKAIMKNNANMIAIASTFFFELIVFYCFYIIVFPEFVGPICLNEG